MRSIFHSSDAAIRGHVFCSFLALAMQKYLDDLSCEAGVAPEWKELLRDLDRLQQVRLLATPPRTDSAGRQAEPCAGLVGCGSSAGRSS